MSAHKVASATLDPRWFANRDIVLFEDTESELDLFPLNVLRPAWEVRCGAGTLREWLVHLLSPGCHLYLRPRDHLRAISAQIACIDEPPEPPNRDTIFVNGRLIALWCDPSQNPPETITDQEGRLLLAVQSKSQTQELIQLPGTRIADWLVKEVAGGTLDEHRCKVTSARFIWDYMRYNPELLMRQLDPKSAENGILMGAHALRELPAGVELFGEHPLYVSPSAKLRPGVVLSTESGPIFIGERTEIEPHTFLTGPLYIGSDNRVKAGAVLYGGSSFGPHCRVAGEISQSVFQGYINKQHDGFVGNSILGEWVNLGADTVTSNLRNDYGKIKIRVGTRVVESNDRFIGLIAGDHTKTGINTMFNTGTVVGVAANVYGGNYPPRYIKSFAWGGAEKFRDVPLSRTLEAAEITMPRRGRRLTDAERELLQRHYDETNR